MNKLDFFRVGNRYRYLVDRYIIWTDFNNLKYSVGVESLVCHWCWYGIFLYVVAGVVMTAYFSRLTLLCDWAVPLMWWGMEFSNLSIARECGTGKAFGESAFLETIRRHWCGPKVGTQKENTEHGLEVRKVYKQKLQRIVSNIGSRTSSTLVLLLLLLVCSSVGILLR